jgi:predicted CoA-substrate-specific enzyme activase
MYYAGVDLGSTITKVAIADGDGNITAKVAGATGPEYRRLANQVMSRALDEAGLTLKEIGYVVATGYGRVNAPFADCQITELTCHARGVSHLFPGARTAIDIGGQDAKVLKIDNGKLVDFIMNDRCAAGTGRFLEMVAKTLNLKLEEMGEISLRAKKKVAISNTCTVFAQSEIVALISEGRSTPDILAGLHDAIAGRVVNMVRSLKVESDVILTGGVALNRAVVAAITERLDCAVLVPDEPLFTGASGGALLALELAHKAVADDKAIPVKERRLTEVRFYED